MVEARYDGTIVSDVNIHENDILRKLNKSNVSKSPGPDGLHPCVMFETPFVICDALDVTFKKSFTSSCLPNDWKLGHITLLFKKGKRSDRSTYLDEMQKLLPSPAIGAPAL